MHCNGYDLLKKGKWKKNVQPFFWMLFISKLSEKYNPSLLADKFEVTSWSVSRYCALFTELKVNVLVINGATAVAEEVFKSI